MKIYLFLNFGYFHMKVQVMRRHSLNTYDKLQYDYFHFKLLQLMNFKIQLPVLNWSQLYYIHEQYHTLLIVTVH